MSKLYLTGVKYRALYKNVLYVNFRVRTIEMGLSGLERQALAHICTLLFIEHYFNGNRVRWVITSKSVLRATLA